MTVKREHLVFGALALVFFLILAYEAFYYNPMGAPMQDGMMDHHRDMHGFMTGQGPFGLFGFNILFWILILVFLYLLLQPGTDRNETPSKAIHILEERYAKGEITKEEFDKIMKDLESSK